MRACFHGKAQSRSNDLGTQLCSLSIIDKYDERLALRTLMRHEECSVLLFYLLTLIRREECRVLLFNCLAEGLYRSLRQLGQSGYSHRLDGLSRLFKCSIYGNIHATCLSRQRRPHSPLWLGTSAGESTPDSVVALSLPFVAVNPHPVLRNATRTRLKELGKRCPPTQGSCGVMTLCCGSPSIKATAALWISGHETAASVKRSGKR